MTGVNDYLNSKTKKTHEKSVETGSVTDQERPSCWLSAVFNGRFPMAVGKNYCQYWCAHLIIKTPYSLKPILIKIFIHTNCNKLQKSTVLKIWFEIWVGYLCIKSS